MEINFNHGDPLELADQAFLFKRTVRQAAMSHKVYATFMAKPLANEPGSSMHIHQSVLDKRTGRNLFADSNGRDTALFRNHVAGLQRYLPLVMPLLAPNVNSYRRLRPRFDAPINVQWGIDNRSFGLRVPISTAAAGGSRTAWPAPTPTPIWRSRPRSPAAIIGMIERLKPTNQIEGSAYRLAHTLPRTVHDALHRSSLQADPGAARREVHAGPRIVKRSELEAYQRVISSWEREHLLLNV